MKTILSCTFKLETNRFLPALSDEKAFRDRLWEEGEEAVRARLCGANAETAGFADVIDPAPDFELRPLFALEAQPGGPVTKDVFDRVKNALLDTVAACKKEAADRGEDPAGAPAAILLALHGAMVAEGHEDADGDLLASLRKAVGRDCPIFATLDLHVNLSRKMVENATALWPCEKYPHTDYRENGRRAAACLLAALRGEARPVMRAAFLPMLFPYTPTEGAAFLPYFEKIRRIGKTPGVLNFRFTHGFFASDVTEGGPAAIAVTDGDPALAERISRSFADEIYENRASFYRRFYTAAEAVAEAKRLLAAGTRAPIVLADVADNAGSGATEDSTALLAEMIRSGVDALFAMIFDPETVAVCERAGEGAEADFLLGGKTLPEWTGGPLAVRGRVLKLSDGRYIQESPYMRGSVQKIGRSALIGIGQCRVIVSSIRLQPSCRAIFRLFGEEPERYPLIGVKSAVHFRASYEPVAGAILEVEVPALGPMDPRAFTYRFAPKDFYPLSE